MNNQERDQFKRAYKQEKDLKVSRRMLAVNMVCINDQSIQHTADYLMQCPDWVSMWVQRYREGGIDALRDLPRTGRPCKISINKIEKIISKNRNIITPKELRYIIQQKYKVTYHITAIRKILYKLNMSVKRPRYVHVNRASIQEIRRWQKYAKRHISYLKSKDFTVVIQDESFFVYDPKIAAKYWSIVGKPIIVPYTGKHKKIIACGSISTDNRTFFRTYPDSFDKNDFLGYLKLLHKHFGKVLVIMDASSIHTAKIIQQYINTIHDVKVLYLPTATPDLSAIEEYWHQSKRDILVSEYYGTFETMRSVLSTYLRSHRTKLDVMRYIGRHHITPKNF